MKIIICSIIISILFLFSCSSTQKPAQIEPIEFCKDAEGLKWMTYKEGFDANEVLKLAAELVASAEADAKLSKDISASGNFKAKYNSDLAKTINQNVYTESKVSQDFWEQDLAFRQTYCFLLGLFNNQLLTDSQRNLVFIDLQTFNKTRDEYLKNLSKKKASSTN